MIWPSPDAIQYWSGLMTIVGVSGALVALGVTMCQLSLSQRAGSATALVALHDSLQQCWSRFLGAENTERPLAFGDLCNTIEISCAALSDRIFFGESRVLLEDYLLNALKLIETNDSAREQLIQLLQDPETFINIRRFLTRRRKEFRQLMHLTRCHENPFVRRNSRGANVRQKAGRRIFPALSERAVPDRGRELARAAIAKYRVHHEAAAGADREGDGDR